MKIQIQFVADKGDLDYERLVFRVLRDVDLGDFMLVRTGFEGDQVTTEVLNTFWFPYKAVTVGDIVVVYSKTGSAKQKQIQTS